MLTPSPSEWLLCRNVSAERTRNGVSAPHSYSGVQFCAQVMLRSIGRRREVVVMHTHLIRSACKLLSSAGGGTPAPPPPGKLRFESDLSTSGERVNELLRGLWPSSRGLLMKAVKVSPQSAEPAIGTGRLSSAHFPLLEPAPSRGETCLSPTPGRGGVWRGHRRLDEDSPGLVLGSLWRAQTLLSLCCRGLASVPTDRSAGR
jgi:hypothetical protein